MTTRTELITLLQENADDVQDVEEGWGPADRLCKAAREAADMLEADASSPLSEESYDIAQDQITKLQAAARLALEQLNKHWHYEMKDAIDALTEALK